MIMRSGSRRHFSPVDFVGTIVFGFILATDIATGETVRWTLFAGGMCLWMLTSFVLKLTPMSDRTRLDGESAMALIYGVVLTLAFAPALLESSGWSLVSDALAAVLGVALIAMAGNKLTTPRETESSGERL